MAKWLKEEVEFIEKNLMKDPKEVYKTVKYIISAEYLNGSAIDLNGGLI